MAETDAHAVRRNAMLPYGIWKPAVPPRGHSCRGTIPRPRTGNAFPPGGRPAIHPIRKGEDNSGCSPGEERLRGLFSGRRQPVFPRREGQDHSLRGWKTGPPSVRGIPVQHHALHVAIPQDAGQRPMNPTVQNRAGRTLFFSLAVHGQRKGNILPMVYNPPPCPAADKMKLLTREMARAVASSSK